MASFNSVIIVGNVTRDPELKYTPKGMAIARIGLAINRKFAGEDGQQREEVTFVDVDAFGKQAETIGQHVRKGSSLLVDGRLKLDEWTDKQSGQKRTKLGVVLEGFQFLGKKDDSAPQGQPAQRPTRQPNPPQAVPQHDDDGIPPF
jgi:single-strand DNA-binding protein